MSLSRIRSKATFPVVVGALLVLLLLASVLSLWVGHGDLSDVALRAAFLELRGMRVAAAFFAGAALAVGGVMVQGLFRNPLASPEILGTTAGAALGGKLALFFYETVLAGALVWISPLTLVPLGSLLGALLALSLLLVIVRVRDDVVVLLLVGFLLSSLFLALGGFVMALAQERWELARALIGFSWGDLSSVGAKQLWMAAPLVVIGSGACWFWGKPLDILLSGDEEARSLGVNVKQTRFWCIVWTSVLTSAAVGLGGNVGFVGLVVPHALRPFVGVRHRRLMFCSVILGGAFLVLCDVVARVLPTRSEVPLGVVTGIVGAPMFLLLLSRTRREVQLG
ncbi:MAG: iron ABC transporter permease [Polyangiaceae bacterium]|nr:iron ABC transporter permease [Polyangiaceae bacterium]